MKELYIQIKDEVGDQIIRQRHGLSKTESNLFFYLLKLVRFGDGPVKVKVAEILLAGIVRRKSWLNKHHPEYGDEYVRKTQSSAAQEYRPTAEYSLYQKTENLPDFLARSGTTFRR